VSFASAGHPPPLLIGLGFERLGTVASGLSGPVEQILDDLAASMLGDGVSDDTAMLGFRVG
jgi:hypothetical protein